MAHSCMQAGAGRRASITHRWLDAPPLHPSPTHLVPCTSTPPSASLASRTLRVILSFTELLRASNRSQTAARVPAGRQAARGPGKQASSQSVRGGDPKQPARQWLPPNNRQRGVVPAQARAAAVVQPAGPLTDVGGLGCWHGKGAPLMLQKLWPHHALQHNQRCHERLQRGQPTVGG